MDVQTRKWTRAEYERPVEVHVIALTSAVCSAVAATLIQRRLRRSNFSAAVSDLTLTPAQG